MAENVAGVVIPDSPLVREATELVRAASDDLLFNHSRRAYLWGMLHGSRLGLEPDPELLYVAAMFHDLGLTPNFRRTDQRFELDGADAARTFLLEHDYSHDEAQRDWLAVALHTTREIPDRLEPEIALLIAGVATDVVGAAVDGLTAEQIAEVITAHPRTGFAEGILRAFHAGMKDRPETTFGTMNADVLEYFDPTFTRTNLVDLIRNNGLPE
jgi:hypothetical protein